MYHLHIKRRLFFRNSVSVGTGLFHDAVDGACRFFFVYWPHSVRNEMRRTACLVVKFKQELLVDLKFAWFVSLCITGLRLT